MDFDLIGEAFGRTGGKWLMDETCVTPDGQVRLIGLTCTEGKSIAPRPGCRNVLLIHYPLWAEQMRGQRFDLMLAGHSHGGQVRLPFYGSLLTNFGVGQFEMGLYQTASGPLYVNPGIGYFYLNVRFCCRPELTFFEI